MQLKQFQNCFKTVVRKTVLFQFCFIFISVVPNSFTTASCQHCADRCFPSRRRTNWLVRAYVRTPRESIGSSCHCTATWWTRGRSGCGCCSTCTARCSGQRTPVAMPSTVPGVAFSLPARPAAVRRHALRRWPSAAAYCRPSHRTFFQGLRLSIYVSVLISIRHVPKLSFLVNLQFRPITVSCCFWTPLKPYLFRSVTNLKSHRRRNNMPGMKLSGYVSK